MDQKLSSYLTVKNVKRRYLIVKVAQNYKIYINESVLILASSELRDKLSENKEYDLVVKYRGKRNFLLNYIDLLEKSLITKSILIYSDNYKILKSDFKSLYQVVPAAGGLITNEFDEILFIHRRGYWDLPKGKMEKGEKKKNTAIREVMEETGIQGVSLKEKLMVTNHTFRTRKNTRAIKKSYWYWMTTLKQRLIPQTEEDIKKADWMTLQQFNQKPRKVYSSIQDVLDKYNMNNTKNR